MGQRVKYFNKFKFENEGVAKASFKKALVKIFKPETERSNHV